MKVLALFIAAGALMASAAASHAQQVINPRATPMPAPHVLESPSVGNRVSPFGRDGVFPSNRFVSELFVAELTREAGFIHTPEVDLANAASILIDRGDCAGAKALLVSKGASAMAERVAPTCEAKRRGLI